MSRNRNDRVVRLRPASRRINDDEYGWVLRQVQGLQIHGKTDVRFAENLLQAVEGQARQLGLDQVCV